MSDFANQSDKELAAAGRMLAAELAKVSKELVRRGIDRDVMTWADGNITVEYNRVTTEPV